MQSRQCIVRGIALGFLIVGPIVSFIGFVLYNWLVDLSEKFNIVYVIVNSPSYTEFTSRLMDAMNRGEGLSLPPETVSTISPQLSSIKVWVDMFNIEMGGAISNLLILLGIGLTGLGIGGIIGWAVARHSGER